MCIVCGYQLDVLLTFTLALGGYAIADHLHISAPLEAVAAGLVLRWSNRRYSANIAHDEIEHFWTASLRFIVANLGEGCSWISQVERSVCRRYVRFVAEERMALWESIENYGDKSLNS